jgi:maltooligosyltrehalose trehalohydrolase
LAVLLDTVYNHFGPEGNYLGKFGPYLADRYHTPWGNAVNFDGPDSDSVRRFFLENARMWVRDFHVDGLRLDAVQTMYDFSAQHILAELQSVVQEEAGRQHRTVHMIAETDQNDVRLVQSQALGGHGLDGVWSDDFHHSVHALLTGECEGYYCDFGRAENLVKAFNDVYVYDGVYSTLRRRRHGNRVGNIDRTHFIVAVQNHDQTGNRALGERLGTLLPPEAQRLACALLLVSPCTPLLFMGEEYGETAPFPFFCSFSDERLIKAIRRGRRREFADLAFRWRVRVPDPQSVKTLDSAKLQWQWPEGSHHAQIRSLYADLLAARRRWPALRDRWHTAARLETVPSAKPGDSTPLLWVERGNDPGIVIVANLSSQNISPFDATVDRRNPILSTGELRYGGTRAIVQPVRELLPYELLVFGPREYRQ